MLFPIRPCVPESNCCKIHGERATTQGSDITGFLSRDVQTASLKFECPKALHKQDCRQSVLSTTLNECCTGHSAAHPPHSHHSIALDRASCCYYFSYCCFCLPLILAPRLITKQLSGPRGRSSACLPAHSRLLHPAAFFSRSSRSNGFLMADCDKLKTCSFMTRRAVLHQAMRPRIQLWQDSRGTCNDARL